MVQGANRISVRIQDLILKRRQLRAVSEGAARIEWVTVNRALRQSWQEDRERRFRGLVAEVVANGRSWKKVSRSMDVGKNLIAREKNSAGQVVSQQDEVAKVFQTFYNDLYQGDCGEGYRAMIASDEFPQIQPDEVVARLRNLTSGKSPGKDGITGEMLRFGAESLGPAFARIFNECLRADIPTGFGDGRVILLSKGGDSLNVKNYRPITLLPVVQKVLTGVLNRRVSPLLDTQRSISQMGFRSSYSTIDGTITLNHVIANCNRSFRGGGALLLVRNSLSPLLVGSVSFNSFESIFVDITVPGFTYRIGNIYRSPSSSTADLMALLRINTNFMNGSQKCIVMGDFNMPTIDWITMTPLLPNDPHEEFLEFMSDSQL